MRDADRIQPCEAYPFYWQLGGRPVVLLGGSVEDNLFQIPDPETHLDRLASAGGNYVRCTMSSRDPGDVWPFERDPDTGLNDLRRPGAEYWRRFEVFLELAAARGIVAQVEVWDRFDFAREPWRGNPFNPKNNAAYTAAESGLVEEIGSHPAHRENAFFRSVPALENNERVLRHQRTHVDRLLEVSLTFGNVLYCIDNETNESPEWGRYWAEYLRAKASEAGRGIEVTEMWDAHDITDPMHEATWKHPETYSFVDVSQNNHNPADRHWENLLEMRRRIVESGRIRPMNSVKVYGANTGHYGSTRDGLERFWRNLFAGLAAVRFHRPASGLGLSDRAFAHIRSARMLSEEMDFFGGAPHNDLLARRSWNEAYAFARPGAEYAVFFTDGGDVYLDTSGMEEQPLLLHWLDVAESRWLPAERVPGGVGRLRLTTPRDTGYWVALVKPR